MSETVFIDYYEALEISPNANADTVERVFRFLAQRYHPDHPLTGNSSRFSEIVKAYEILKNPEKRAQYDVRYKNYSDNNTRLAEEANDKDSLESDFLLQEKLLSILYVKLRRNIQDPGIGNLQLERLAACPREHIEFHLWYLKEKGWITRLENGLLAITVNGVDKISQLIEDERNITMKLLTDSATENKTI
jgi:curved DNA-binding protein CbpA